MSEDISIVVEFNNYLQIGAEMQERIRRECHATTEQILQRCAILINSPPKTGKIYKRGNKLHQASAPGEAPAADIGALAGDTTIKQIGPALYELTFNAEYAEGLEFGTPRLAARPFLRPSVAAEKQRFIAALKKITEGR